MQTSLFGNTLEAYAWFAGVLLGGLALQPLLTRLLARLIYRFIQKYSTGASYEQLWNLVKKPLRLFTLLIIIYFAFDYLQFPSEWKLAGAHQFGLRMLIYRGYKAIVILSFTWLGLRMVDFLGVILAYRASLTETKDDDQLVPFIKESIKIVLGIFGAFFILGSVFHVNIASLIAGLGIGGLAIALAAKETIENLIGCFTIFFDKPFVVGDQVQVGSITGHVEKIGFRSTRLRTSEKSYVTVPNKKMIDAELINLTLRTQRRAKFTISLEHTTNPSQLKQFVNDVLTYLNTHAQLDKSDLQVHLFDINNGTANISIQYYVHSADGALYLSTREEINFKILELVAKNGCRFSTGPIAIMQSGE